MKAIYQKVQLWLWAKGFAFLVILGASLKRQRMSHNNGIVGRGKFRVVDKPEFPEHEFFKAGREFTGRLRHAAASFSDDAMMLIYAATLKFADTDYKSPLDIEMNTGKISLFWNAKVFLHFAKHRKAHNGIEYQEWYPKVPEGLVAAKASVRRPESYTKLNFYTQTVYLFKAKDGKTRYLRYRLTPWDRSEDDPIPPPEQLNTPWNAYILPGETRSRNHLKNDYQKRVENGGVKYHLQLQLWEWKEGDTDEVFNSNLEWDEVEHPWMDLADIEITEIIPYEQANYFHSSIGHQPPSLGLIKAKSIYDYNSVNYMRWKVAPAKFMRVWMYKIFGMPKDTPDFVDRNN